MKKEIKIVLVVIILVLGIGISYFMGYSFCNKNAFCKEEEVLVVNTFYAKIKSINSDNLVVEGLSVNDINYRGEFSFVLDDSISIEWRNTEIGIDDLDVGDNISITYLGNIQETYPAKISEVVKVKLLDDEK